MIYVENLAKEALAFGFSHAAPLDAAGLKVRDEVRDMCNANVCRMFDKSWMCPPACGSIEENAEILKRYRLGLLVQTTGELEDDFDYEGMQAAGELQKERFAAFRSVLMAEYPDLLALSSGGCTLCKKCTYPDAPCVRPNEAMASMEAFGLLVSDVCTANELGYYYGPGTITYTGCYLIK